ncbi:MAG: hypothetical protein ACT4QE_18750 [Anaerolineales bacterium]
MNGRVVRGEWAWAAAFAALVMALTTMPYVVGALTQTDEWRFSGFLLGVEDGNSYIAKMGQGARGEWLFRLPYSSEPQTGAFVYGFYLLLGKLSGPDHIARVLTFHLSRFIFGWLLLMASYRFLAEFLPFVRQRRLGLILVALGGGLGWLLIVVGQSNWLGSLPLDLFSPEAYSFLILYSLPHLAAARCLFLLALLAYLRGRGAWAGAALFGVSLIQPLYVIVAWIVIGLDVVVGLWQRPPLPAGEGAQLMLRGVRASMWRTMTPALLAGLLSSPVVLYSLIAFNANPVLKQWLAQNILPSPHPLHYLLGYGVLLVPAVWGWRVLQRRWPRLARFVAVWAILLPILLYLPISTQRRLIEGFQLPLVAVAVLGLTVAWRRWRRVAVLVTLVLCLPTTALILVLGFGSALMHFQPEFVSADRLQAFQWLNENATPGEVALSEYKIGNELPAYTPLVAYIGHGPETIFLAQKQPRVEAFFRTETSDAERLSLLSEGRIAYVLRGPVERRVLSEFDPRGAEYLRLVYSADGYEIYRIELPK